MATTGASIWLVLLIVAVAGAAQIAIARPAQALHVARSL